MCFCRCWKGFEEASDLPQVMQPLIFSCSHGVYVVAPQLIQDVDGVWLVTVMWWNIMGVWLDSHLLELGKYVVYVVSIFASYQPKPECFACMRGLPLVSASRKWKWMLCNLECTFSLLVFCLRKMIDTAAENARAQDTILQWCPWAGLTHFQSTNHFLNYA